MKRILWSVGLALLIALGSWAADQDSSTIRIDASLRKRITIPGKYSGLVGGFHPNFIEVRRGEQVVLELHSEEGTHSLAIPDYGVKSQPVHPGETTSVSFTPDRAGEFRIVCDSECGPLHRAMVGTLVVAEPER